MNGMEFLAAGATYLVIAAALAGATELFGLGKSGAAFTGAMLSIGGYGRRPILRR